MWRSIQPEQLVPHDYPLRPIRAMVDQALKDLSPRFSLLYSHIGRPSTPPEQPLRALLLQAFYSVRSERQLMEQVDDNLLFRWFVGLSMDDPIWDPTIFTKNWDRLFQGDIAQAFFTAVLAQARQTNLVSADHFTVDGTLLEAWASHKSFKPKAEPTPPVDDDPGNPTVGFRGETRRQHHPPVDDRPGRPARPEEQRPGRDPGLARPRLDGELPRPRGSGPGHPGGRRVRAGCRALAITPHVAQNITVHRDSAIVSPPALAE